MNRLYTLLAVALMTGSSAVAQLADTTAPASTLSPGSETWTYVEQMPEPDFDMNQYLSKAIVYPSDALLKGISGRVVVKFIVNEEGNIERPMVIKSVFPSIDAIAIRAIQNMPKWKPGLCKGKPIKVYYTLPIKFTHPNPRSNALSPVRRY